MAGLRITDLGTINTAATNDLLYIVDVSNTTQSPEGTSSQIEVGKMFSSGSYTPSFTVETNGIVVTNNSATFIKVGKIVTCSAQLQIQLDTGQVDGTFEMSLPVASDFTSAKNLFGLMQFSHQGTLAEIVLLDIQAEIANNTCFIGLEVATAGIGMSYCTLQFQYEVI